MKTKEILEHARALVDEGWTQGAYARDEIGSALFHDDPAACKWCAIGAVYAASKCTFDPIMDAPCEKTKSLEEALYKLTSSIPPIAGLKTVYEISDYNDHPETTKKDILKLYNEAIRRCEDEG